MVMYCENAAGNHNWDFYDSKSHICAKVLQQTLFLSNITTRKKHGWIRKLLKTDLWALLKERGLPQKVMLLLYNAPCHPRQSVLTYE
jgi:hypothetical protein